MSDGSAVGPEISLGSQGETLRSKEGISLYKSNRFSVFVPSKPNIPLNEGLHVGVSDGHDVSDFPKEVLARYTMALGSAKVLAESGLTQDAWANTRLEDGQMVSAYGRVPGVEESWRKPVDTFNRNVTEISQLDPNYNTAKLQELFSRYLPKWEQLTNNMELFTSGVNGKDIAEPSSKEEVPIWENDRFTLVVVTKPHLKGIHLVAHPKESVKRQWQTVIGQDGRANLHSASIGSNVNCYGGTKIIGRRTRRNS